MSTASLTNKYQKLLWQVIITTTNKEKETQNTKYRIFV